MYNFMEEYTAQIDAYISFDIDTIGMSDLRCSSSRM